MSVARAVASIYQFTRLPLWARSVVLIHAIIGGCYLILWLLFVLQGYGWSADLTGIYTGWLMVLRGEAAHLYDFAAQAPIQQALIGTNRFPQGLLPYVYPPHTAALFAPLGLIPLDTAFVLWSLLQLGMLAGLLATLHQMARDWAPHERWLLFSGVIAFPPLFYGFILGTFSLWALVCLLLTYQALTRQRDAWAGGWLVLATFKPQSVFMAGVMLLGARRWWALASGAAIGGIFFLLSSALIGWHIWPTFLRLLLSDDFTISYNAQIMHNLKGLLLGWFGDTSAPLIRQISGLGLVLGSALTIWLWRGRWQPAAITFAPRFALTVLIGVFFSPHLYPQDSIVLLAVAVLFYSYLRQQRPTHLRSYAIFVLLCPLLFLLSRFVIGTSLGIRPPLVIMLILAGWIGRELWRQHQGDSAAGSASAPTG